MHKDRQTETGRNNIIKPWPECVWQKCFVRVFMGRTVANFDCSFSNTEQETVACSVVGCLNYWNSVKQFLAEDIQFGTKEG